MRGPALQATDNTLAKIKLLANEPTSGRFKNVNLRSEGLITGYKNVDKPVLFL